MALQSFEDTLRQIVKARLNPDTEDLIKRKNDAEAKYYGEPYAISDSIGKDVYDPNERRRLVESARQGFMSNANTYDQALTNRDLGIDKVVTAFGNARKEEMDREAQAQQLAMAQEELNLKKQELAISQQNANSSSKAVDKADKTFAEQVDELMAAGYPREKAMAIAASQLTGNGDLDTISNYLYPPKQAPTPTIANRPKSGLLGKIGTVLFPTYAALAQTKTIKNLGNSTKNWWNSL